MQRKNYKDDESYHVWALINEKTMQQKCWFGTFSFDDLKQHRKFLSTVGVYWALIIEKSTNRVGLLNEEIAWLTPKATEVSKYPYFVFYGYHGDLYIDDG